MTPCDKSLDNSASMTLDSCYVCTGGESFMKSTLHCDTISNSDFFWSNSLCLYLAKYPAFSFTLTSIVFPALRVLGDPSSTPNVLRGPGSLPVLVWTVNMDGNACHRQCFQVVQNHIQRHSCMGIASGAPLLRAQAVAPQSVLRV